MTERATTRPTMPACRSSPMPTLAASAPAPHLPHPSPPRCRSYAWPARQALRLYQQHAKRRHLLHGALHRRQRRRGRGYHHRKPRTTQLSAVVTGTIRVPSGISGNLTNSTGEVNVSFDYISTTIRVEAKNPTTLPNVKGSVGREFTFLSANLAASAQPCFCNTAPARSRRRARPRSSRGTYTFSKSSSGIYEVNTGLF
jgi:hypothetical protein